MFTKRKSFIKSSVKIILVTLLLIGIFYVNPISANSAKVLFVAAGGLGDQSFIDDCYSGILKARREFGFELDVIEPVDASEVEAQLLSGSRRGEYDLIIALGFIQLAPLTRIAPRFPDQKYLLVDVPLKDQENVRSVIFRKQEEGFVLGALNALMTSRTDIPGMKSDQKVIGVILGVDVPTTKNVVIGYQAGARYVDPEVRVLFATIGNWNDQAKARELALSQYDMGADIVQHNAGQASLGIFEAARDRKLFASGLNIDQTYIDPDSIYVSGVRGTGEAVNIEIGNFFAGNFDPGVISYGYTEGTTKVRFSGIVPIPRDVLDTIRDIENKIRTGEIVPPGFPEEVEPFFEKHGT